MSAVVRGKNYKILKLRGLHLECKSERCFEGGGLKKFFFFQQKPIEKKLRQQVFKSKIMCSNLSQLQHVKKSEYIIAKRNNTFPRYLYKWTL